MSDIPPSVPKNFIIRCQKCLHARMSTGLSADLTDLHEYKGCASCGGGRNFRCPMCGGKMKMKRVSPNT